MLGFLDAGVSVAYHFVTALVPVLTPIAGGLAAAAAIVAFTIAVRLLLVPFSYYALRGQAAQARLQPQLQELRRRYARQPDRLQRELTALYQREGGNMLAGCLPLLAQLPFFSVMYRLFLSRSVDGQPNLLLAHRLLGAPLGGHLLGASGVALVSSQGLVFLGLLALLAVVGWVSARLAGRTAQTAPPAQVVSQAQDRITRLLTKVIPYSTVVIALFVPLAAGIYLLTTTSWSVAERAALRRRVHQASMRKTRTTAT
jgi:YidC/Oxa1 family membrane protein insertase